MVDDVLSFLILSIIMDVMRQRNKRNVIYYKKNRVAKKIKKEKHKKAIEDKNGKDITGDQRKIDNQISIPTGEHMDIENIDTKVPSVPPLELLAVPARTPDPEIMIEVGGQISLDGTQYKLTHLIGCGGFGKVFAAKGEDIEYALKVFGADEANRDDALHEVTVLNHLPRNRLLLEYVRALAVTYGNTGISFPCIVFPLLRFGTLHHYIHGIKKGKMPDDEVANISYQLANAVYYLQSHQWAHCDLKPENIMFANQERTEIIIIDFGMAKHEYMADLSYCTATPYYRATECFLYVNMSQMVDNYALGCIIFEMATGNFLFDLEDDREHLAARTEVMGPIPNYMLQHCENDDLVLWGAILPPRKMANLECFTTALSLVDSNSLRHLLSGLLQHDPEQRFTLDDVVYHQYFDRMPRDTRRTIDGYVGY